MKYLSYVVDFAVILYAILADDTSICIGFFIGTCAAGWYIFHHVKDQLAKDRKKEERHVLLIGGPMNGVTHSAHQNAAIIVLNLQETKNGEYRQHWYVQSKEDATIFFYKENLSHEDA